MSAEPDSTGNFSIQGIDITGRAKAIVSITDKNDVFNGWLILDSLLYRPANVEVMASQAQALLTRKYSDLKKEAIVKNTIKKKYKLSDTIRIDEVVVTGKKRDQIDNIHISRSHYIEPDKELIITPDMEASPNIYFVMAGRIPGLEVSGESITIRGESPLILLDGIPLHDASEIGMIQPAVIDRIDVLYWSSLFGSQGANGIINVITRRGDYNYKDKPESHSTNININGFDTPRIFYSPNYNTSEPSAFMPDTRTTIYWEPNIVVEKGQNVSLSCFNADKTTLIEVNAEGITSEGIPVTGKTIYEVRSDK